MFELTQFRLTRHKIVDALKLCSKIDGDKIYGYCQLFSNTLLICFCFSVAPSSLQPSLHPWSVSTLAFRRIATLPNFYCIVIICHRHSLLLNYFSSIFSYFIIAFIVFIHFILFVDVRKYFVFNGPIVNIQQLSIRIMPDYTVTYISSQAHATRFFSKKLNDVVDHGFN